MAVKDNLQGGGQKATYYLIGNTRINVAYSGKVVKAKLLSSYQGDVEVTIDKVDSDIGLGSEISSLGSIRLSSINKEGQLEINKKENPYLVFSLRGFYDGWDNLNSTNVLRVEIDIE